MFGSFVPWGGRGPLGPRGHSLRSRLGRRWGWRGREGLTWDMAWPALWATRASLWRSRGIAQGAKSARRRSRWRAVSDYASAFCQPTTEAGCSGAAALLRAPVLLQTSLFTTGALPTPPAQTGHSGLRCEEQGVFQITAHEARGSLVIMRSGPGVLSDRPMGGLAAGSGGRRSLSRFARCTTHSD